MTQRYGSDLIVDLLNRYDIPFAAFNPGATIRGIHDSILNHADNRPEIVECQHEQIAVAIAHGYAKVTGRPMAALVHDLVGLLHGSMAVYCAFSDRVPMLLLGATGPMAVSRRRPRVDWDHTALVQGNAVRDFVKWDDQPFDAEGVLHSFARGFRIACTEPAGPVYLCFDVAFQEDELADDLLLPDPARGGLHTRIAAPREDLAIVAEQLVGARRPVIVADHVGRHHESVAALVELAELLAAPVVDLNGRMNFPNTHPLFRLDRGVLAEADLLLALDVRDLHGCLLKTDSDNRPTGTRVAPEDCRLISVGLGDLEISSWSHNSQHFVEVDTSILADTRTAIPELTGLCRERAASAPADSSAALRESRMAEHAAAHAAQRAEWRAQALASSDLDPMTPARMVLEVGEAIKGKDWVLTANTVKDWARRLWDVDVPRRHPGKSLGTATQIGISLGVALAHRGTGRLVVDLQPDGDLMYNAGALWVAAHHRIPMLVVMYNNRAYYNSWSHQTRLAKARGRSLDHVPVGTELNGPAPDFAGLARSFGWHSEGPVSLASDLPAALSRAIEAVEGEGRPALVDALTQPR
ncbi:MAG: thiamine pyrophosphate-binding protein [Thermoleophilia bacterium]